MRILQLEQGSQEWLAARAKRFTASEASAMKGSSKYMSRDDLLKQKATGEVPEVSEAKQKLFDRGHSSEAGARSIAEGIVGEELYPCTCEDDSGVYLASMDGITMAEDIGFEHKLINADLRTATAETLDDHYKWQMDQQMMVTGAEKILFMASDGTEDDCNWFWYERDESRIKQLVEGWDLFSKDLENYTHREIKPEVVGRAPVSLPALRVEVTGMVTASNLEEFKRGAAEIFAGINTELETDEDFANAKETVKWCKTIEERLVSAKENILAQTGSIDEAMRVIEEVSEMARQNRLNLDKRVKAREYEKKREIALTAKAEFDAHIKGLNAQLGSDYMPAIPTDFNGAMKGKRTIATLTAAANDECARARIEANRIFARIEKNLATLKDNEEYGFLFHDRHHLLNMEPPAFEAIVKNRVLEHKAAEEEKRKKAEEEARIAAEKERQRLAEEARQKADEERAKASKEAADEVAEKLEPVAQPAPRVHVFGGGQSTTTTFDTVSINSNEKGTEGLRPSDSEIIEVIALKFRVHESKVIEWLLDMDLKEASEKMMANI